MKPKISIIRRAEQQPTQWSGGTTTQLYIFPANTEYSKRNFQVRISTATVEDELSIFTSLPGFSRQLMVLQGNLIIEHEGYHTAQLTPFTTDIFDGSWNTKGTGRVTDFNLMTAENVKGSLSSRKLKSGEAFSETLSANTDMIGYYLWEGNAHITGNNEQFKLSARDFMIVETGKQPTTIHLEAMRDCIVIVSHIALRN